MITLTLPFPPSDNHQYAHAKAGHVYLSPEVHRFRRAVDRAVQKQLGTPPLLRGRLAARVELSMPDQACRDVPNYAKALLDALTLAKVWVDDEQLDWFLMTRGRLIRGSGGHGGRCVVQIVQMHAEVEQLGLPGVEQAADMVPF